MLMGLLAVLIIYVVAVRYVKDTRDGRDWTPYTWPQTWPHDHGAPATAQPRMDEEVPATVKSHAQRPAAGDYATATSQRRTGNVPMRTLLGLRYLQVATRLGDRVPTYLMSAEHMATTASSPKKGDRAPRHPRRARCTGTTVSMRRPRTTARRPERAENQT